MLESCKNMPTFLAKTNYREPLDPDNNNFTDLSPGHVTFFERLQSNRDLQESFAGHMVGRTRWKANWTDVYDTKQLVEDANLGSGGPLVVDVGGHLGLDLFRFLEKHPDVPAGSLILQDRPEVIARAMRSGKVRAMEYDFFTPQPVHGTSARSGPELRFSQC